MSNPTPPKPAVMTSIATLWNPLDQTLLLQFNTDQDGCLVAQSRQSEGDTNNTNITVNGNKVIIGQQVTNGSQIVAFPNSELLSVFGVATQVDNGVTTNYVALLSPYFNAFSNAVIQGNSLAFAYQDMNTAWLYYLTGNPLTLTELALQSGGTTVNPLNNPGLFSPQTSLAAFYDPVQGARCVITQDCSGNVALTAVNDDEQSTNALGQLSNAKQNSPFAAVYNNGQFYIYYVAQNKDLLWRATGASNNVTGIHNLDQTVDQYTQISVTADPQNKKNHVFFVANGGSGRTIVHYVDQLPA
ncbi:hypothetical protein TWF481_003767 [Arthrobotrys musiformis]|uniref:Uncharacterized protein n=1 Tax=Arthrobotrys musiformis TaxID=47236 RepID=A0AAV9WIM9_9PEZI